MNTLLRTAVIFGVLAAGTSFAAGPIARHQAANQARINRGFRSGELTRPEAARLQARDNAIQRTIRRNRIDGGGLSWAERRRIDLRQDALSRDIARQKHDRQYRETKRQLSALALAAAFAAATLSAAKGPGLNPAEVQPLKGRLRRDGPS